MRAFQDMLLQPLKALLMRALQQQLSKYIHNIELEELGLLGGDVVLENLEIRKDVLHDSLRIPTDYDFSRGFIKELRIHIPWTRLQSRPIEIKFKTVEIIISPTTHTRAGNDPSPNWLQRAPHARQSRPGEEHASSSGAATGWMQQLLTKVLANMSISVSNLVLKYEDADVVLSAALKSLTCFSADPDRDWTPAFASLDDPFGLLHKLVRASHLTVCLDRYCAPDSTRRRQVQAFEVPILNRASFDVRLLACVWLVAPGPGEPTGGTSEDGQAQADGRDFADEDAVEVSGKSWSAGTGVRTKAPVRETVGLFGRLVGVELRGTPKKCEAANAINGSPTSGSASAAGTQLASATAEAAAATAEREINWLPVPCVCPMLRDGWSRRASSSYSPFYDGDGVWSRSEGDQGDEATRMGVGEPGEQSATHISAKTSEQEEAGGTARLMPSPTVVADVLIEDLSFSLSNLQVLMMKELIDRAVDHVASNASRNDHAPPSAPKEMPLSPDASAAPVSGRWWPSLWRGSASTAEDPKTSDAGQTGADQRDDHEASSTALDEQDVGDPIFFVVVSTSVGSVSLSLLEHQPQAGGKGEVDEETEAATVEEPVSISVPVHGLGTVSVSSVPVAPRPLMRPPVAFVVAEVTGVVVDAHVLPDGKELSADVKVQVSSVVVQHARLGDAATSSSEKAPRQGEARMPSEVRRKHELEAEPVISWGVATRGPAASASHGDEEENDSGGPEIPPSDFLPDPRSAVHVRRCLVERLRGSPVVSAEVAIDAASSSGAGMESPRRSPRKHLRQAQVQVVQSPASLRPRWLPATYPRTRGGGRCALQYRLLKQRDVEDEGLGGDGFSSTSACHDMSLGLVRMYLTVALLEQLLNFAGLGKRGEHPVEPHARDRPSSLQESKVVGAVGNASTSPAMTPPARSASVPSQGEPWRERRASWSPVRGASTLSGHTSPKTTPVPPPIATLETSLHLVLFPTDVALDLAAGDEDCEEHPSTENSEAFLVLSVGQVEMTGSESASSYSEPVDERREWNASAASRSCREDDSRQRVCTLSLSMLSVTFVDGSTIVTTAQEPTAAGNIPFPLATRVLAASVRTDLPTTHRLVRLRGCRVTAEVISSVPRAAHPQAASGMIMVRRSAPKKKKHDVGFNSSCKSIYVCASAGIAPLALEMYALSRKIKFGGATTKSERRCCNSRAGRETGASRIRWTRAWRRGVLSSLEDVSFGGVMKGQDYQLTGNIGRLTVGRVDDESRDGQGVGASHVASFQGHESGTEALSWSLETSSDEGVTSTSVTSDFKSAALHFLNIKRVVRQVELALEEWKVGVAGARLINRQDLVTEVHAWTGTQKRPTRPVHFDIRGSAVSLQLPFELRMEAESVRANSRRVPRIATRGRTAEHKRSTANDGEMTMDLFAGDVMVFHAMHGARASPEDAQPPAIRCAARGIASLRPAVNAISVALESEHVQARLTPAFCSSFGSFVRFMVGPPPAKPTAATSSTVASRGIGVDSGVGHTALSSNFDLRVRQVVADFVTSPCSPWAVTANLIVGGVAMRQKSTAAASISPATGSEACFEMSCKNIEGTQRRDPRRNAPVIPREAVALIGEYLKRRHPEGHNCAAHVFFNWLAARREVTRTVADEGSGGNGQPFVIPLKGKAGGNAAATGAQAFSVITTVSGPRQRLVNSLTLRIAPMLLACYPPVVRLLVGHYNRFGGQAFRSFPSRSNLPRKKVGLMTYDVDIQGCSAVLLSSLAVGARGLHVSAGEVTIKENGSTTTGVNASSPFTTQHEPSSRAGGSVAPMEPVVSMAGFVGPVEVTFVRDWRRLLPKHSHATSSSSSGALGSSTASDHAQLCVPIDLRWAVHYDRMDHFRQDISLSSVQLYLDHSQFDLCARLLQLLVASDFPGALPPKSRSSSTDPTAGHRKGGMVAGIAVDDAASVPLIVPVGVTGSDGIDSFLNLSLRLPLLQVVLAMGTRDGPDPPVLEIDVASVRLARGGVLTVRHMSVNSWPQQRERRGPMESATAPASGSSERGYRVFERSGQSEESGKDFARVEVRVPTTTVEAGRLVPPQPQLDVVFQVEPFNIHVNPGIIHSLAAFATPVPFEPGSAEALEAPFPYSVRAATAATAKVSRRDQSASPPSSSTAANDSSTLERPRSSSSAGMKQAMDFEEAAQTAAISMKLIASHVSLILSSYPGGPAFIVNSSHIFLRAITRQTRAGGTWATRGCTSDDGIGTEGFARLSRVSCSVDTSNGWLFSSRVKNTTWAGEPRRTDLQGGDAVLKPFDVDVLLTRTQANASDGGGDNGARCCLQEQGWQAAINVDKLYFRLSAAHTRSLERLADLFIPAVATAQLTAVELARGAGHRAAVTSVRGGGLTHADDLRVLQGVESSDFIEETALRPRPGQAVFYGVGALAPTASEEGVGANAEEPGEDDWVTCCMWHYWGLRRVVQLTLPREPLSESVSLLEGLVLDSLEVELSFVDPLTGKFKAATRFTVPCKTSSTLPDGSFATRRARPTVEPSQPFHARRWRLSWRVPTWVRPPGGASPPIRSALAVSLWSCTLLRSLSVQSTPAGPAVGPSYISTTLSAQRVTLALLTDDRPSVTSRDKEGNFPQAEEIVRVVVDEMYMFAEAGPSGGDELALASAAVATAAVRGSALVAIEVQDFSNFLRLPLLSHALVTWDVASSGYNERNRNGDTGSALSPFRPVVSAAVEVRDAVISVSATATQCISRCLGDLSHDRFSDGTSDISIVARDVPSCPSKSLPSESSPPRLLLPRQERKGYVVTNRTDRSLWFGQVSTTETVVLGPGVSTAYRWRTIPSPVAAATGGAKGGAPSQLVLLLRLALHQDRSSAARLRDTGGDGDDARGGASFGAWTEPFPADHAGTYMRLLRSAGGEGRPLAAERADDIKSRDNATAVPVWIAVSKQGLQTRIELNGEWIFTNHLPLQVQVAWATSTGVGNSVRRLGERPGIRGGLSIDACGPDEGAGDVDPGKEARVPRPDSYSALTACAPVAITSTAEGWRGRLSELMLEFRLATPGSAAVVGSVGPPPVTAMNALLSSTVSSPVGRAPHGGRRRGSERGRAGERSHDGLNGGDEEVDGMSWAATRQSDWVEARPGVHLSLISCASPDPASSGFWFWCVASRKATPLSDCAACLSSVSGHRCHSGQMMIDLRPIAMMWNRCSLPLRVVLESAGRGRGGAESGFAAGQHNCKVGLANVDDRPIEHPDVPSGDVEVDILSRSSETRAAGGFSVFHLEGSSSALQPGGRTAVCQQPFVDYRLTVAAAATGVTEAVPPRVLPSDSREHSSRPFVASVPSELLSRSCESRWLPLHERALDENVLCPLVIVASRPLDAHWPSLSLRVYPGLSVRNHLTVPLSLVSVFSQPSDAETSAATQENGSEDPSHYPPGYDQRNEKVTADTDGEVPDVPKPEVPFLRRGGADGEGSFPTGGGDGVENIQDQSPPMGPVSRVFRIPAESLQSAWDIHDSKGDPVPFLLPTISVEIGLCSEGDVAATTPSSSSSTPGSGLSLPSDPRDVRTHGDQGQPALGNSRSPRLTVKLDSEFSELVLIPWGPRVPLTESGQSRERSPRPPSAVLPVFVTLVREAVSGGVDLVRLEIHPRVVVHNATSLPVSLSLLGAHSEAPPLCRVHLTPNGPGSSMMVLALPGRRGHYPAVSTDSVNSPVSSRGDFVDNRSATVDAAADAGADATGTPKGPTSGTLQYGLSWLMKSASYKAAPVRPTGFWADLELACGWQDEDGGTPVVRDEPADGVGGGNHGKMRVGTGIGAKRKSIISLLQSSGGASLRCEPASITMMAESGRRAARICVAMETQTRNKGKSSIPASPTRHILLYQDPQPDLTIYNRAAGPVTILLDCGTLLEVGPGETVEHSWPVPGGRDPGASAGATVNPGASGGAIKRPPRPAPVSPPGQRFGRGLAEGRSRNDSESSFISIATQSSAPESPVAVSCTGSGTPQKRGSARVGGSSTAGSHVSSKGRAPGKLFGGADAATLQHWFKCKGGGQGDQFSSWSNPLWVARGVQVIRFDRQGAGSAVGDEHNDTDDGGSDRRGSNDWGFGGVVGGHGTFGAGPQVRDVQVHVMERAGGFVMSFAEGGFENISAGGGATGREHDATAEKNRSVLSRWAETQEQHLVLTVSKTTLQLLDDSDIIAVAATAMHPDFFGGSLGKGRGLAAKSVPNGGARGMDGWIGGNWEGPTGFLLDAASAALPAAAIPAILSVFVGGSCTRLWRAAPAVRQGMSTLDVESSWHLKDRVGVDVCLEMLQVDNHVAGHNLPVIFCFRQGGSLVCERQSGSGRSEMGHDCRFTLSLLLAEPWNGSRMPAYLENVLVRSSPIDVCFEDSVLPPLVKFLERAGFGGGVMDGSYSFGAAEKDSSASTGSAAGGSSGSGARLPASLAASMVPRLFIQRVDIGALVVRATIQGCIPVKQVFLSLDKSPLLFRPVSLRGVLARPDEIAEQIASNYAVDALLRSLAVVGSLEALGSPTTLLTEWGKGVYDLFAMPIKAVPHGPSSTIRATFSGISSLVRHASAGTLSSVSGMTNALSRNLGSRGGVVRPIAGTMGLVHRTSRSLIASTGVDSEWTHAEAAEAANPAVCRLNADLWYRWCLLPPGHEFLYRTPALCSNVSYSQANVPVTIVLSSKAVFLYRGGSGCETLWKQIEHQHITLVEQSAENAPAELILNARAFRRPRSFLGAPVARSTSDETAVVGTSAPAPGGDSGGRAGGVDATGFEQDDGEVGGFLMKLSLPNSACCRELAQLLQSLSENA